MRRGKFWLQIAGRPGGRNPPPRPEAGLTVTHSLPQCNPSPIISPTCPPRDPPGRRFDRAHWASGTPPTVPRFLPILQTTLHPVDPGAELHSGVASVRSVCVAVGDGGRSVARTAGGPGRRRGRPGGQRGGTFPHPLHPPRPRG
jgi:hypothetical protein